LDHFGLENIEAHTNTMWVKRRRRRWTGHAARVGAADVNTHFWWGDQREGDHLEDPGVDGRIILKWIFKTCEGKSWT